MAARKIAPRKTGRLKVFMTQIGFHNWLVAAQSQKGALEAWDVKENLFAIGDAKVVTDEACIELAMTTPGVPVAVDAKHAFAKATKVLRLDEHRTRRKPPAASAPEPTRKKPALRKKEGRPGEARPGRTGAERFQEAGCA